MLDSTANPQLQIPVESQPILDAIAEKIGFVPNLFSTLASQTKVLEAFVALDNAFGETSLNPVERQAVLLAASVENQSVYCVAGHTIFARSMDVPESQLTALRSGRTIGDRKLDALQTFTRRLVATRGHATIQDVDDFIDAGFTRRQMLDVILGVAVKTITNYVTTTLQTPLDEPFEAAVWSAPVEAS